MLQRTRLAREDANRKVLLRMIIDKLARALKKLC